MTATPPGDGSVSGSGDGAAGSPTVLRILVGGQLRQLREASGMTRDQAGWEIRSSESKISRMELGRVGFRERDVADLLSLYGVLDEREREALLSLARQANAPGWWQRYGDASPKWFEPYLGLEAAASVIRTYEVQFLPGLLQTPDYARAVIRLGHGGAGPEELERRVALRVHRQQVLYGPRPPRLWVVVDEAALRRPIGGHETMRGQVRAVLEAARLPHVTFQVIPFRAGGHPAAGGAFTLLRFPDPELPDIVYMEQLTGGLYVDQRREVDTYVQVMEGLCVAAAPPEETLTILDRVLQDLDRG